MGIFDIFSAKPAEDAAAAKKAGLTAGYAQATPLYDQAINSATNLTNEGLARAASAAGTGIGDAAGYLGTGFTDASALAGQGLDAAKQYGAAAVAPWTTVFNQAQGGANAYGDATGANGPDGYLRAKANFTADPGYGFQLDQGLQALQRTHAAAGSLASGGADADTLKFSQGLADNSYGNYVARLAPYLGQEATAASGIAGVNTGLGTTANSDFLTLAGLKAANANKLADASIGSGSNLANLTGAAFTTLGQTANNDLVKQGDLAYGTQTGIGNANADAELAKYSASSNFWNTLIGGAGLALKATGVGGFAPTTKAA